MWIRVGESRINLSNVTFIQDNATREPTEEGGERVQVTRVFFNTFEGLVNTEGSKLKTEVPAGASLELGCCYIDIVTPELRQALVAYIDDTHEHVGAVDVLAWQKRKGG
ncbi:MAG TPA: hypothetical protein VF521_11825 [Pyrinomonadaceae bacterium]